MAEERGATAAIPLAVARPRLGALEEAERSSNIATVGLL